MTLIPCFNAGHPYSFLCLPCSQIRCSLFPKIQTLCTSEVAELL
ncbi:MULTISPECIES: hypothetical protein [unclassified Moorena]|nr:MULTISPECIES: hypothetical protein [unclassified Moorena]